jgi:hypothetical protein
MSVILALLGDLGRRTVSSRKLGLQSKALSQTNKQTNNNNKNTGRYHYILTRMTKIKTKFF